MLHDLANLTVIAILLWVVVEFFRTGRPAPDEAELDKRQWDDRDAEDWWDFQEGLYP